MNTRLIATLTLLTTFAGADAFAQTGEDVPPPPPPVELEDVGEKKEEPAARKTTQPAASAAETDAPTDRQLMEYELSDGQVLRGYGTSRGDNLEIELATGAKIVVPYSSVKTMTPYDGPEGARTTHRTRYLYSPSGMMLKEGEGYISQKELFFTSVAYGITDNISVIIGSAVPLWFLTFNVIGGFKVGGSLTEDVHMSAGAEALFIPAIGGGGFGGLAFGNITLGRADSNLTLNLALPFVSGQGITTQIMTATLSGYHRFNDTVGIVSENWVTFSPEFSSFGAVIFNGLAARFHTGDFTIDTGFVLTSSYSEFSGLQVNQTGIPLPWIDFSWGFGG